MKKIAIILLLVMFIIYIFYLPLKESKTNYRILENVSLDYNKSQTIHNLYNITKCDEKILIKSDKFIKLISKSEIVDKIFSIIFLGNNNNILSNLTNYIISSDEKNTLSDVIFSFFHVLVLFFLLFAFSIGGWFVCCSCCCYDYCPIILKPNSFKSLYLLKYISNVIVLFTGLSILIPAIFAYNASGNMQNTFTSLFCESLITNFVIKEGYFINETYNYKKYNWLGYNSFKDYDNFTSTFQELAKMKLHDKFIVDENMKKYENFIKSIETNYTNLINNNSKYNITFPNLMDIKMTNKSLPYLYELLSNKSNTDNYYIKFKNHIENTTQNFLKVITDMKNNYKFITEQGAEIRKLLNFNIEQKKYIYNLNNYHTNLISSLQNINEDYLSVFSFIQLIILLLQILCSILNLFGSTLNFLKFEGKLPLIIGNTAWVISGFILVLLSIFIILIYIFGVLISTSSSIFHNFYSKDSNYSENNKVLECFTDYNLKEINSKFNSNTINTYNDINNQMLKVVIFTLDDPFNFPELASMIYEIYGILDSPEMTFKINDQYPLKKAISILNQISDYNQQFSYQFVNNCKETITIELVLDPNMCIRYNYFKFKSSNDIRGRFCFFIGDLKEQNITNIFPDDILNCSNTSEFFKKSGYDNYIDEIRNYTIMFIKFYNQYVPYRDEMANFFRNIFVKFRDLTKDFKEWAKNIKKDIIDVLNNKLFKISYEDISNERRYNPKFKVYNMDENIFNIYNFISCHFFNKHIINLTESMKYQLLDDIYSILVSYIFLYIYGILSSVFGLIASMTSHIKGNKFSHDKIK